jgi:hypothetical protein
MNKENVFNDLCHIAAIAGEENNNLVMENLVKTAFVMSKKTELMGVEEVSKVIKGSFNVDMNEAIVQSCIDRLINKKEFKRKHKSKSISITNESYKEVENKIEQAKEVESLVRASWIKNISHYMIDCCENWEHEIWNVLVLYLGKIFRRHGVQTISLVCPDFELDDSVQSSFDNFLQEAITANCKCADSSLCIKAVSDFFINIDEPKSAYLSQILDGTFNYFSLSVEDKTMSFIRSMANELEVFLDTNFLFGLIDLGDDHEKIVSMQILDSIKKHKLPYRILCHRATIEELQRYLHSAHDRLRGKSWSPALSRAAISTNELSGADRAFHTFNSSSPLDVDVFFSKFDHLEKLLEALGISICEYAEGDDEAEQIKHESVARFKEFIEENRKFGSKTYQSYSHDMTLLSEVKKRYKHSKTIFESGSIILTKDFNLYLFARREFSGKGSVAPIAMPALFLQLISALSSDAREVKRGLVEAFAMPEFRALRSDYKRIKQKALSYLTMYSELSEETAIKILANEIVLRKLKKVEDDELKFQEEIESALVDENNRLAQEAMRLEDELCQERIALRSKDKKLETAESDYSEKELELGNIKKRLSELECIKNDEIADLDGEVNRLSDEKMFHVNTIKLLISVIYLCAVMLLFLAFKTDILSFLNSSANPLKTKILSFLFVGIVPLYLLFPKHFWKWASGHGAVFFAWLTYR